MVDFRTSVVAACSMLLAACAQDGGSIDVTTGTILPSLNALPALPAAAAIVPALAPASDPRAPERISGNLYRIDASDKRIEDSVQRENYTLLRAAESARQLGASHFIVVDAAQSAVTRTIGNPDRGQSARIRVLERAPGAEPPMGAISAYEIIHFFGPSFGRGTSGAAADPASTPG